MPLFEKQEIFSHAEKTCLNAQNTFQKPCRSEKNTQKFFAFFGNCLV